MASASVDTPLLSLRQQRARSTDSVLLTGAAGFLGRHILWDLLRREDGPRRIYCLLRPDSRETVEARLERLLATRECSLPADARDRCRAVAGDITDERLVRDPADRERLLNEVTWVIHCAATVQFDLPLSEARSINVSGTRNVLRFAQEVHGSGRLRRVDYFSTAYVAGRTAGVVAENDLLHTRFNNTYERTKWEAERVVREFQNQLPITVFRPSIIVGDSQTGYTSNFRVLYWPLKILARGLAVVVPADPKGILDVVPIDYVVAAFGALSTTDDSLGKCYHLAAGPERQTSLGEVLRMGAAFFGVRPPRVVPPQAAYALLRPLFYAAFWGKPRQIVAQGRHYAPYFAYRASFDTTAATAHLRPLGIEPPRVREYFRTIMQYCVDTGWGRRPTTEPG